MGRRFLCAGVVLAVSVGFALAEEFTAAITKVENGKVTFEKFKKGKKGEREEAMTLPVADNVKVVKGKFSFEDMKPKIEPGDALPDGLKNERFKKIGEKGIFAQIVTNADNTKITDIRVVEFGKKKKKDAN